MKTLTESQCIWMECGYIDYKLCDRNFDCEHCEFDKAIHAQRFGLYEKKEKLSLEDFSSAKKIDVHGIDLFSANHFWFSKIKEDDYYCGVDETAFSLIVKAQTLMFPEENILIPIGAPLFWIVTDAGVVAVTSPANAKINFTFHKSRRKLTGEFANWTYPFFILTVSRFDANSIYENGNPPFDDFVKEEKRKIKELFTQQIYSSTIGATNYDGGNINFNSLSIKQFYNLLKNTFTLNL